MQSVPDMIRAGATLIALGFTAHGLIHAVGFARALGWAPAGPANPAVASVSRLLGLGWLTAAALLTTTAALSLAAPRWWWAVALPSLVVSQLLIASSWSEAKWGTLVNLLLLLPVALALIERSSLSQATSFRQEVARHFTAAPTTTLIKEGDLAALPPPVQRYLRFVRVVGKPRVQNFHVVFRGQMRPSPSAPWMDIAAEQYSFIPTRARLFFLRAARFGVPFDALHMYMGASATMQVKVASLLRVVDARGPKMDQSETVTMLNDLFLLAPAALIDTPIVWRTIDDHTVLAAFSNAGHTVSATVSFGADGALTNFSSDDRYQSADGKTYHLYRWSTPVTGYRDFHGYRIAVAGEAIWHEPQGPLPYARFEITTLDYNVASPMQFERP
jgi:hypothetical protein